MMNLARPFKAGINRPQHLARRVSDAMKPKPWASFNRRYATDDRFNSSYPALKDRAKITSTLRLELRIKRDS